MSPRIDYTSLGIHGYTTEVVYPAYVININEEYRLLLEVTLVATSGNRNCIIYGLDITKNSPTKIGISRGKCIIGSEVITVLEDTIISVPEINPTTALNLYAYRDPTTFYIRFATPSVISVKRERFLYLATIVINNKQVRDIYVDPVLGRSFTRSQIPEQLERQIVKGIATTPIIRGTIVNVFNNLVEIADCRNQLLSNSVIGIALNSAIIDDNVEILTRGRFTNNSWSLTPDKPLLLGENGQIVQTPPSDGLLLYLGRALNQVTIFLEVEKPILR